MASIAEQLDALPVLDALQRVESPLGAPWVLMTGHQNIGQLEANGFRASLAFGGGEEAVVGSGARYGGVSLGKDEDKLGPAVVLRVAVLTSTSRYFGINLRMTIAPGYGLRAKFIETSSGKWTLKLEDWENGVRSLLKEVAGVEVSATGSVALYVMNEIAYVWAKKTSADEWVQVAEAGVGVGGAFLSSFPCQGGIDAAGNVGRYINFAAGVINQASATTRILRRVRMPRSGAGGRI